MEKPQIKTLDPLLGVKLADIPELTGFEKEPSQKLGQVELSDLVRKHRADAHQNRSPAGTSEIQVTFKENSSPDPATWVREFLRYGMVFKAEEDDFIGKAGEHCISGDRPITRGSDTTDLDRGMHPTFKQQEIGYEQEGIVSLHWDHEQRLDIILRILSIEKEGRPTTPSGMDGSKSHRDWSQFMPEWDSKLQERVPVEPDAYPAYECDTPKTRSQNGPHKPDIHNSGSTRPDELTMGNGIQMLTSFLEDNVDQVQFEGYNLTLSLAIELVLMKGDRNTRLQTLEDIVTIFEQLLSTKMQSTGGIGPDSFGSAAFEVDEEMKDMMLRCESVWKKKEVLTKFGLEVGQLRCIQWRKMILPQIFKSLHKFGSKTEDYFTISVHIGKKGGYNLQEIKRISKTIMLYGDFFDYTSSVVDGNLPSWPTRPDFGSSRHNPKTRHASNSQLIDNIDKATSLSDVIEIMNPSVYDLEEYRFGFYKLRSQGTIVWTQSLPSYSYVTEWISGILSVTTAAINAEDSYFIELAKNDVSWDNFALLLANNKEGIRLLSMRRAEAENRAGKGSMPYTN